MGNDTENNIRAFEMATSAGTCPLINMPTPMAQDGGLSPAASTAAPSDLLNLDASPQKRGRVDQPAVTMDALRDLFRGELQLAVGQLNEKVGKLEATMQAYRAESSDQIAEIKGECRGHQERLAAVNTRMDNMEARVANLEKNGGTNGEQERAPAMIIGGWHQDTEAAKVIEQANKYVAELRLDLDMRDRFVPGLRRGYAIIPLHRKEGESEGDQRQRVQHCIRHVRNANLTVGTKDNGAPSKLFLNISQPPEKRRKVQVAAKCKRLLMEQGALAADVEVEYATGQVWLTGTRLAAATAAVNPPHTTQTGTQGWIDIPAIAAKLHRNLEDLRAAWLPLGAVLR